MSRRPRNDRGADPVPNPNAGDKDEFSNAPGLLDRLLRFPPFGAPSTAPSGNANSRSNGGVDEMDSSGNLSPGLGARGGNAPLRGGSFRGFHPSEDAAEGGSVEDLASLDPLDVAHRARVQMSKQEYAERSMAAAVP